MTQFLILNIMKITTSLTLSRRRPLSYKKTSPLICGENQWTGFLYDNGLRLERVNGSNRESQTFSLSLRKLYTLLISKIHISKICT